MPYLSDATPCYDTVVDRRGWRAVRVCVRPRGLSRRIACTALIPAVRRIADNRADAPHQDLSITESIRLEGVLSYVIAPPSIRKGFLFLLNPFAKTISQLGNITSHCFSYLYYI